MRSASPIAVPPKPEKKLSVSSAFRTTSRSRVGGAATCGSPAKATSATLTCFGTWSRNLRSASCAARGASASRRSRSSTRTRRRRGRPSRSPTPRASSGAGGRPPGTAPRRRAARTPAARSGATSAHATRRPAGRRSCTPSRTSAGGAAARGRQPPAAAGPAASGAGAGARGSSTTSADCGDLDDPLAAARVGDRDRRRAARARRDGQARDEWARRRRRCGERARGVPVDEPLAGAARGDDPLRPDDAAGDDATDGRPPRRDDAPVGVRRPPPVIGTQPMCGRKVGAPFAVPV